MASLKNIQEGLISKILNIKNTELLMAIDKFISLGEGAIDIEKLTQEQKEMLEMSEQDILEKKLISQEDLEKNTFEWLDGK